MCVKTSRVTKRIQLLTFPIGDKHLLLIGEHEVTLEAHSGLDLVTERNRHFLSTVPHSPHQLLQYAPIIVEENVSVLNRLVKHSVLLAHDDLIPHNQVMLLLYLNTLPSQYMISIKAHHDIGVQTAGVVVPIASQVYP